MAEKFTQGEWKFNGTEIIQAGSGARIALMLKGWPKRELEANARLIAQAPAMYEALVHIHEMTHDPQIEKYIQVVLAKIEGRE